ncbi:DUF998 domain-containing protein [Streptomyces sp. NPDC088354]|uniref:DUF998 domain-containing protein n=1 Tax=Streptomyces sp. NPDC088354 TaxID=3365856 RepID=UPI00382B263A
MRSFTVLSSAAAPILLIGGWTLAEQLQAPAFDPLRDTISALAALDATHRGVMTVALIGTGFAYLCTAVGLTEISRISRLLIALGGVGTVLVAAFPLPAKATAHAVFATIAFLSLAIWPFFAPTGPSGAPRTLRRPLTVVAGLTLLTLVVWFGITQQAGGLVGLTERLAAGAQALWPLIVALSLQATSASRSRQPAASL